MSLQLPEPTPAPASPSTEAGTGFPVYEPSQVTDKRNPFKGVHKQAQHNPDNERELLFTIGGTPFYMPKDPSPQLGFKMLRDTKRHGQMYAIATLIEELLGPQCLDALADTPDMTKEDWDVIADILSEKVLGRVQNMGKD